MICPKCNANLSDDAKFCTACGAPLEAESPATEQRPQFDYDGPSTEPEQPVTDTPEAPEAEGEKVYYEYGKEYSNTKYNKKKRRRRVLGAVIPLAVIAVVAAIVILNLQGIVGLWNKYLSDPEDYLVYAEAKSLGKVFGDSEKNYDKMLSGDGVNVGGEGEFSLAVSDNIVDMLEEAVGIDFEWLNDISIAAKSNIDGNKQQVGLALKSDGDEVIGGEVYLDSEKGAYLALPKLTDTLFFTDEYSTNFNLGDYKVDMNEFKKTLPNAKELKKIFGRYLEIVLEHLESTRKSTDSITVDGITEKLVMVEVNLERTEVRDLVKALLKELSRDEAVLSVFRDMEKLIDDSEADLDGEFVKAVEGMITAIDDDPLSGSALIYRSFINADHEVVGRELRVDDKRIFYYVTTHEKNDYATEMRFGQYLVGSGYGTVKKDVFNGSFTLTDDGKELIEVVVKDFEKSDDALRGTFRILPAASLIYELNMPTALAKYDAGLEVKFDIAEDEMSVALSGLTGEKKAISIAFDYKVTEAKKITVPDGKTVEDAEQWVETFDKDAIIDVLKGLGLPEQLISIAEQA